MVPEMSGAVVRLTANEADLDAADDWIECDVSGALNMLRSGEYVLAHDFADPPTALLTSLTKGVWPTHLLGPSAVDGNGIGKIANDLILGGVRQLMIGRNEVTWASNKFELLSLVASHLWRDPEPGVDILLQLIRLHDRHTAKFGDFKEYNKPGSDNQLRDNSLVDFFVHSHVGALTGKEYATVSEDWCAFYFSLKDLVEQLATVAMAAIRDAVIVCIEDGSPAARLTPPSKVKFPPVVKRNPTSFFCLTADLPKEWFSTDAQLRTARKRATSFANHALSNDWGTRRRPSMGDIKFVLMERFRLTENGAKTALNAIDPVHRNHLGNIAERDRVSLHEINSLFDNWEG